MYIDEEDVVLSREQVEALERVPHVNRKKAQIDERYYPQSNI